MTSPWVDQEPIDAVKMYTRVTATLGDHETRIADLEAVTLHVDDILSPTGTVNTAPIYSILAGAVAGTSASFGTTPAEVGHSGIITGTTGTQSTGRCSLRTDHQCILLDPAADLLIAEWIIKIPTLSTGTEEFQVRCGLLDVESGAPADGVYFEYDRTASVNWRYGCRSGSSGTPSSSSTAVTAGVWYTLRAEITGTASAEFLINGISVGTVSTNIPSGVGHETGLSSHIVKSVGTTARTLVWDRAAVQL